MAGVYHTPHRSTYQQRVNPIVPAPQTPNQNQVLMLVSALLTSAENVTLSPEMLLDLMSLLHQLMLRKPETLHPKPPNPNIRP